MADREELKATIARIQQMEQYLDEVLHAMSINPSSINEDATIRERIQELAHYYENGQWLMDYDCDARGELPTNVKRGVLSQDTLYDLLCELNVYSGFVSVIFEEKPKQWGYRGDPYLWEDMKNAFSTVPLTISQEEFVKEFKAIFKELTGAPLTHDSHVLMPKYANGGMSSGQISGEFWLDKALPLLLDRLEKMRE